LRPARPPAPPTDSDAAQAAARTARFTVSTTNKTDFMPHIPFASSFSGLRRRLLCQVTGDQYDYRSNQHDDHRNYKRQLQQIFVRLS
jgi:hypothetical protein